MFEDEVFVDSINIAKLHVFAACLSDLCIYTTAYALQHLPSDDSLRCRIARASFETGIANNREQVGSVEQFSASEATNAFDIRLRGTVWADAGAGWENFTVSPKALIEWAPIAPQLKRYDTEVVSNSIMFAWHGVREQFKKRVEPHKIAAEATGSDQT